MKKRFHESTMVKFNVKNLDRTSTSSRIKLRIPSVVKLSDVDIVPRGAFRFSPDITDNWWRRRTITLLCSKKRSKLAWTKEWMKVEERRSSEWIEPSPSHAFTHVRKFSFFFYTRLCWIKERRDAINFGRTYKNSIEHFFFDFSRNHTTTATIDPRNKL